MNTPIVCYLGEIISCWNLSDVILSPWIEDGGAAYISSDDFDNPDDFRIMENYLVAHGFSLREVVISAGTMPGIFEVVA